MKPDVDGNRPIQARWSIYALVKTVDNESRQSWRPSNLYFNDAVMRDQVRQPEWK